MTKTETTLTKIKQTRLSNTHLFGQDGLNSLGGNREAKTVQFFTPDMKYFVGKAAQSRIASMLTGAWGLFMGLVPPNGRTVLGPFSDFAWWAAVVP